MGDNLAPLMTVEEARDVVRSDSQTASDLHKAEIVLSMSNFPDDQMVSREVRKARRLEVVK